LKGATAPCRKTGIYKAKPYYQGGWENKEIIYISELLDKAKD
jgi:hypothetical protein